jgi:hypothetical protein
MIKDDGWGKEWPKSQTEKTTITYSANADWPAVKFDGMVICEVDKEGNIDLTPLRDINNKTPWIEEAAPVSEKAWNNLTKQGSNLVDDQAYLYFQCEGCQNIFDPHTKSFAQLNQRRADAGWKVKWNVDGMGYKVYCVECGEK